MGPSTLPRSPCGAWPYATVESHRGRLSFFVLMMESNHHETVYKTVALPIELISPHRKCDLSRSGIFWISKCDTPTLSFPVRVLLHFLRVGHPLDSGYSTPLKLLFNVHVPPLTSNNYRFSLLCRTLIEQDPGITRQSFRRRVPARRRLLTPALSLFRPSNLSPGITWSSSLAGE